MASPPEGTKPKEPPVWVVQLRQFVAEQRTLPAQSDAILKRMGYLQGRIDAICEQHSVDQETLSKALNGSI